MGRRLLIGLVALLGLAALYEINTLGLLHGARFVFDTVVILLTIIGVMVIRVAMSFWPDDGDDDLDDPIEKLETQQDKQIKRSFGLLFGALIIFGSCGFLSVFTAHYFNKADGAVFQFFHNMGLFYTPDDIRSTHDVLLNFGTELMGAVFILFWMEFIFQAHIARVRNQYQKEIDTMRQAEHKAELQQLRAELADEMRLVLKEFGLNPASPAGKEQSQQQYPAITSFSEKTEKE